MNNWLNDDEMHDLIVWGHIIWHVNEDGTRTRTDPLNYRVPLQATDWEDEWVKLQTQS